MVKDRQNVTQRRFHFHSVCELTKFECCPGGGVRAGTKLSGFKGFDIEDAKEPSLLQLAWERQVEVALSSNEVCVKKILYRSSHRWKRVQIILSCRCCGGEDEYRIIGPSDRPLVLYDWLGVVLIYNQLAYVNSMLFIGSTHPAEACDTERASRGQHKLTLLLTEKLRL